MTNSNGGPFTLDRFTPRDREQSENGFCWDFVYPGGYLRIFVYVSHSVFKVHRDGIHKPYILHDWLKDVEGIDPELLQNLIYPKGKWLEYDQAAANWRELLIKVGDLSPVLFGEPIPNPDPREDPMFMKDLIGHEGAMWARVQQWIYPFPGGYIDLSIDDNWMNLHYAMDSDCKRIDLIPAIIKLLKIEAGTPDKMRLTSCFFRDWANLGFWAALSGKGSNLSDKECHDYWLSLLVQAGDLRSLFIPKENL